MSNEIEKKKETSLGEVIEKVLITGDLTPLTPQQRVDYYNKVCETVGLNPLTRPFEYVKLNGKLTLYARKDATDQLRKINGVSVYIKEQKESEGVYIVTATAKDRHGKEDEDVGAVFIGGIKGEPRANAIMKTITKAKRRVTLSICGLGFLDETEVETIPNAQIVKEKTEEKSQALVEKLSKPEVQEAKEVSVELILEKPKKKAGPTFKNDAPPSPIEAESTSKEENGFPEEPPPPPHHLNPPEGNPPVTEEDPREWFNQKSSDPELHPVERVKAALNKAQDMDQLKSAWSLFSQLFKDHALGLDKMSVKDAEQAIEEIKALKDKAKTRIEQKDL